MRIYLVAFISGNKIDSVMKLTKSKNLAQSAFIHNAKEVSGSKNAMQLIEDFSNGILDDNATLFIDNSTNLQMIEFDIED